MSVEIRLASIGDPQDVDDEMWEKIKYGYYIKGYNGHYKNWDDEILNLSIYLSGIITTYLTWKLFLIFDTLDGVELIVLWGVTCINFVIIMFIIFFVFTIIASLYSRIFIGKQDFRKNKK